MLVSIRFRIVEPELKDSHLGVLDGVESNDWDWSDDSRARTAVRKQSHNLSFTPFMQLLKGRLNVILKPSILRVFQRIFIAIQTF